MNEENVKIKKRQKDWNVELIRIIACCIVIGTHIKLNDLPIDRPGHLIDGSRTMVGSFFGEGVTIFFLIMGFFFFKNKSFKKLVKRTIISILIPMGLFILFTQIFHEWVMNKETFMYCLYHPSVDYKSLVPSFTNWTTSGIALGSHLWYIFSYVQIVLWFPIIRFIGGNERNAKYGRRFVIILGLTGVMLQDIQQLVKFPLGQVVGYQVVPTCILVMLIGYELYQKLPYIKGKWYGFIGGLLIYLTSHLALYRAQMTLYYRDINIRHVFSWDSTFAIVGGLSLCICILSINMNISFIKKIICFLGDKTYFIYLIHIIIFFKLDGLGVRKKLQEINCGQNSTFWGELTYTIEYVLIIFMCSMVVASIMKGIVWVMNKGMKKVKCSMKKVSE